MKILIVGDPIAGLKPTGDTSLVLARECLKRNFEVFWATDEEIFLQTDGLGFRAQKILNCQIDELPKTNRPELLRESDIKGIFIRKDPPFGSEYLRLCWHLSLIENKIPISNLPSTLLRHHEKLLPFEANRAGYLPKECLIPTFIGTLDQAKNFVTELRTDQIILKPFLGFGGNQVRKLKCQQFLETLWPVTPERFLVQPFLENISTVGDRRVFFLRGQYAGDFVRLPAGGGFLANLAQGGTALNRPLTKEQTTIISQLGLYLKEQKIDFAGTDLIGNCVSEINITSPTGLRTLEKLSGIDLSPKIVDFISQKPC